MMRAAAFEPSSFDAEGNSVELVFFAGADVERRDYQGAYLERLSPNASDWDLSQLIGAPLLDNHDRWSGVRSVLGIVESARFEGNRGVGRVRFGQRPEVQGIATDVRGGIIRNVSFGYAVREWRETTENGVRVRTGYGITPKEISFTALGADPNAKTRSQGEEEPMDLQQQYRTIAEAVGVPPGFADDLATRNVPLTEARSAIIHEAARLVRPVETRHQAEVTRDAGDNLVVRMADGLRSRISLSHRPEVGREFANIGFGEIARRCLELRGQSTLGSRMDLITRAMHTTSDFSAVLAEVYNKELLMLRSAPSPIEGIFKRATADDFRNRHLYEISDGPGLSKVNEKGEIKSGTITDKELASYKIDSYGRVFGLSFKAIVNDDMAALSDLSGKMSRGARSWFAGFLVDTIIANPKLSDNKAVFHADHANLAASGAVPGEATLGAGKLAMRLQTDLSGNPVDAAPKFIVIPAALESTVDKLMAELYPQQPSDAIVSTRNLTPVVDPRFDSKGQATPWYLFADPAIAPVFEFSELSGYEGPRVEVKQGFETLGIDIRVVWHVGAGAIDHRGAWKNPGA